MKVKQFISNVLCYLVAIIFLQTLYFKFTAHPDSVFIFSRLGAEPWGRLTLGIVELFTSLLLLRPASRFVGMVISFLIIIGAIGAHMLVIGVCIAGDDGNLFALALFVFLCCLVYFTMNKTQLLNEIERWKNQFKNIIKLSF
jgi:putative oxidoreductase